MPDAHVLMHCKQWQYWRWCICRCQVINEVDKVRLEKDGIPTEAALTQALTHPSVVRMHAHMLVRDRRQSLDQHCNGHTPLKSDELWLILEYCNKGSVQVPTPLCPSAQLHMPDTRKMMCPTQS